MTHQNNSKLLSEILEVISAQNPEGINRALTIIMNEAMKVERSEALNAEPYERTEERQGYANGFKDKNLKARTGLLELKIPQTRGFKFYPDSLEKGIRSERALKLALAEMYVQGVSQRRVSRIVEEMCGYSVSTSMVSNASKLLDEEIEKWRSRPLGAYSKLIADATYEDVRIDRSVVSGAVLVVFGIDNDGQRSILGVSASISEAEVHWKTFFQSLTARGLHGVEYIVSDAHEGLKAARKAVFPGVIWQRCQFHLQQNAQKYATKKENRKGIASEIRSVFNTENLNEAESKLRNLVHKYEKSNPAYSQWLEKNIPEGLSVFRMPEIQRKKLRTSNMAERQMKEIKRRTKVAMIFPNEKSLLRLVSAILMEQDEVWRNGKRYLPAEDD
ncbi:MAG: IS256 family transposase [Spirochaetales bacterium]|nr:IS256 family transposase [Spirochaetales bacterium]